MSTTTKLAVGRDWPETWAQRRQHYDRRGDAYKGLAYDTHEAQRMGLFAYRDADGNTVQAARRIMRDQAFVQDVDAAAIAAGLVLNLDPRWSDGMSDDERAGHLDAGMAVWDRSRVKANAERWALMLCVYADLHIEPMLNDETGEAVICVHPARHVEVYYDRFDIDLATAIVEFTYTKPPEGDTAAEDVEYRRELGVDSLRWREGDGKWTDVPHGLGRVPLVHIGFKQLDDPHFSMPAGYGMEDMQAAVDSALSQFSVIGTRCADPLLVAMGFNPATAIDPNKAEGISTPAGGDLKYLEPTLTALQALVNATDQMRTAAIDATAEFVFADSGANASGTAILYRAAQLSMKLDPVAARFHEALAVATRIAVALERSIPYADAPVYAVAGRLALPMDKGAMLDMVLAMLAGGVIRPGDAIRILQTLDLVPQDADPEVYAREAAEGSGNSTEAAVARAVQAAAARTAANTAEAGAPEEFEGAEV